MEKFHLSKDVYVKTVALRVNDVERMVSFYKNVLGFILKLEENNLSILGSEEKESRLLILEETDSKEYVDFFKESICISLLIPTEAEFGSLLRRITAHQYPIEKSVQQGIRKSVFLKDPEGNELEISCQSTIGQTSEKSEVLDLKELVKQSNVLYSNLSKTVRFDRITLNVQNKSTYYTFYQDTLGMNSDEKEPNQLTMNERNFFVFLDDPTRKNEQKIKDEHALGVDFFVLNVKCEEEIQRLKQHLEAKRQDFFVDKKLTILTIYDPGGIEWWFVRDQVK